ncbi:hypothetical protein LTR56_022051 [Elasticomyces elasticus]|nr:hypothetical protein LTR56_022051 [Elasticomyces elasticus]KAK3664971.1 hypothetical protein LTR22_004277 [Elasticomyces elasticus]KAK4929790.1 hypothetical protein LTR49_003748 [Elasticomyces elasticus]KAK5756956.1 hypothetical protein LTS12_012906 [Elasticomyces elasticus]
MAAQETPSVQAKTPAQTAKPYGTAAAAAEKAKKSTKAPPKAEEDKPSPEEALKAVEKLETKTKAVNANNIARVANSQISANDEKLLPLMSLKTGKPIEKFPATSKDIEKLSVTTVDAILNALDADRAGAEPVKKEKLRVQIGLKPNPA